MSELNSKLLNGVHYEGEDGDIVDTKAAAFETVNGESVAVFYNPSCSSNTSLSHVVQNKMCVNFIYDLNGSEGPNQVGKDVGFITAFYNKNSSVVAPIPYKDSYASTVTSYSADAGTPDAASVCATMGENLRIPDKDEIGSMFVNSPLINLGDSDKYFWSGTIESIGATGLAWGQHFSGGGRNRDPRSGSGYVYCINK